MAKKDKRKRQYAALPYRTTAEGVEVLLVTSRETRRWIVPKGWHEKGVEPPDMAAREAYEEAGVVGSVDRRPIGAYGYAKRLPDGAEVPCSVRVYPLHVEGVLDDWPEKGQRERLWVAPSRAALMISDGGMVGILLRFALDGAPIQDVDGAASTP